MWRNTRQLHPRQRLHSVTTQDLQVRMTGTDQNSPPTRRTFRHRADSRDLYSAIHSRVALGTDHRCPCVPRLSIATFPRPRTFADTLWLSVLSSHDLRDPSRDFEMTRLHVPSGVLQDFGIEGLGFGLGVSVMADEDAALIPGHNGDFWWSGAHGTHFWISPETGVVVVVLLQNAMGPHAGLPVAPYLVQGLAN